MVLAKLHFERIIGGIMIIKLSIMVSLSPLYIQTCGII